MPRCTFCKLPLDDPAPTGHCSERCLHWDFFGVPLLKMEAFCIEKNQNKRQTKVPGDWKPSPAYPEFGEEYRQKISEALILLNHSQ